MHERSEPFNEHSRQAAVLQETRSCITSRLAAMERDASPPAPLPRPGFEPKATYFRRRLASIPNGSPDVLRQLLQHTDADLSPRSYAIGPRYLSIEHFDMFDSFVEYYDLLAGSVDVAFTHTLDDLERILGELGPDANAMRWDYLTLRLKDAG